MSPARPVLEIESLTKRYRNGTVANVDVSLNVLPGEVFGLLGHNGAGKTTLLNQVLGLAKPTQGRIRIAGHDVVAHPSIGRRLCSVQPQAHAPLDPVTPREAIELMARIRGASRERARRRTAELVESLDIGPWADTKGLQLSGGVRRLAAFAMAVAEPGQLVMFDEPTNDVDPIRRRSLWGQVRALADAGNAVLLVTHNIVEAEGVVDRLAILHESRIVAQGTPAELRGGGDDHMTLNVFTAGSASASKVAEQYRGNETVIVNGRRVMIALTPDECPETLAWLQRLRHSGTVSEFSLTPLNLEDIYVRLVGSATDGQRQYVNS